MDIAVRYYSRSGNTKILAEGIADAAEVEDEFIYAKNKPSLEKLEEVKKIVKNFVKYILKLGKYGY